MQLHFWLHPLHSLPYGLSPGLDEISDGTFDLGESNRSLAVKELSRHKSYLSDLLTGSCAPEVGTHSKKHSSPGPQNKIRCRVPDDAVKVPVPVGSALDAD